MKSMTMRVGRARFRILKGGAWCGVGKTLKIAGDSAAQVFVRWRFAKPRSVMVNGKATQLMAGDGFQYVEFDHLKETNVWWSGSEPVRIASLRCGSEVQATLVSDYSLKRRGRVIARPLLFFATAVSGFPCIRELCSASGTVRLLVDQDSFDTRLLSWRCGGYVVQMRILLVANRRLVLLYLVCAARTAWGCELPAGQSLWIRLTAPVSTYSAKRGDAVHAVLMQDLACENEVVLPMGTAIEEASVSKQAQGGIGHCA